MGTGENFARGRWVCVLSTLTHTNGRFVSLYSDGRAVKTNHRSKITASQFVHLLRTKLNIVISDIEAQELFAGWDKDGNGWLDVEEFVDIIMPDDVDEKQITYIGKDVVDFSTSVSGAGTSKPPPSAQHSYGHQL